MSFCTSCGTQMPDNVNFCSNCGRPMDAVYSEDVDIENNKGMAALAYFLFFVPMLAGKHKTSPYVKYHTNQGTVLFLVTLGGYAIISFLVYIAALFIMLSFSVRKMIFLFNIAAGVLIFFSVAVITWFIIGIVHALKGKTEQLPIIGGINIIK